MQLLFICKSPLYIKVVHKLTASFKKYAAKVTKQHIIIKPTGNWLIKINQGWLGENIQC